MSTMAQFFDNDHGEFGSGSESNEGVLDPQEDADNAPPEDNTLDD